MRLAFWRRHKHVWAVTLHEGGDDNYYEERECACGERDAYSYFSIPLSYFAGGCSRTRREVMTDETPAPALSVEEAPWLDENKAISVGTAPHRWFFDVPDGGIVVSARDLNPIIEHYAEALRAATARADAAEATVAAVTKHALEWKRRAERALSATEEGQG